MSRPPAEAQENWKQRAEKAEKWWGEVCDALSEADPDWMLDGPGGIESAVAMIRKLAARPAGAQPVAPTDGSPFDMAMREYEAAAIKCGAGRNNAQAVDAAAVLVFALYNAKPPSAPVGVDAIRIADDLETWVNDPFVTLTPMRKMDVEDFVRRIRALAQQPAAVDEAMVGRFVAQAFDGSKTSTSERLLDDLGLPTDNAHKPLAWHIKRYLAGQQEGGTDE